MQPPASVLSVFLAVALSGGVWGQAVDDLLGRSRSAWEQGDTQRALSLVNQALEARPQDSQGLFLRARVYETHGELEKALADYDRVIAAVPQAWDAYLWRGGARFKLGRIDDSIADFDRVVELRPAQEPYLWQRGISYYYAGRYREGVRQFESHQTVNPNDVENAVWHYLCVAASSGVEKAQEAMLKVGPDGRVPMSQIEALFRHTHGVEEVLEAARKGGRTARSRRQSLFYAHLYIGLFYHAKGDDEGARRHLNQAGGEFRMEHYMGYVPRVHLQVLDGG